MSDPPPMWQDRGVPAPTDQQAAGPSKGRGRQRRVKWLGLALITAGVALLAVWGGLKLWRVYSCLDSSLARLRTLQELVPGGSAERTDLDLVEAGVQLHGLQDDLTCLRTEVQEFLPLAPMLGWLPKVGPDIASAPALLGMAQALVDGGVLIYDGLYPLIEEMEMGGPQTGSPSGQTMDLSRAVALLDAARPSLAAAEAKLGEAEELQAGLDPEALSARLGRLLDLSERYLPLLRTGVRAAQIAPELLGAEGPRTYLILAQNDDERRPTGGWITGWGLLTISQGQIAALSFQDSWSVDNLEVPHDVPPKSMFRALWAEIWLFRDANWSPDFPTSARVAEQILKNDQGITVDGVIAVDQQALRLLVAAMEPLTVRGTEEPVTGANLLAFIRDAWTEPQEGLTLTENWFEWTTHRKDFMSDLVEAMLDKAQTRPQSADLRKLAEAVWRALQERHILVYLHDARAAELLAAQQWDGALLETQGDYLQVVDANVGFNKVDPNVERTITYQVDLTEPPRAQAEGVVRYHNKSQPAAEETCVQGIQWLPSYAERMQGCYWDHVRFYVPEGARLLTAEREPLPPGSLLSSHRFAPLEDAGPHPEPVEKGKSVFGLFFVLGPGEQRDVRLAWRLPAGTAQVGPDGWQYQLLVQKQSGTPAIPLRVRIALPPGARLVAATPEPTNQEGNVLAFDLSLAMDQRVEILFQDGVVAPWPTRPEERLIPTPQTATPRIPTPQPTATPVPTAPPASPTGSAQPTAAEPTSDLVETPTATVTPQATPTSQVQPGLFSPRQRIGVVAPMPDVERYDIARLGAGWYLLGSAPADPPRPAGMEAVQLVVVSGDAFAPDAATLQEAARRNPGGLWLVGNEPDVIWQGNATPKQYAEVYHRVYSLLKDADPTCQVAIGGISQVTPLRLRYLEAVLAAYDEAYSQPMPVEVWNIHLAILREERGSWGVDIPPGLPDDTGILYEIQDNANVEILKEEVWTFRRWLADHGWRDRPLIVTEFSVLMPPEYGFPFERVRDFMLAAFDFMMAATDGGVGYPADGNRLVQRWAWYSLADKQYYTGNLFDPATGQITPLGEAFAKWAARR